jgi:hypothetical protein
VTQRSAPICLAAFVACATLTPATARAQQDVPLSQLLVRLIQSEIRLAPPPPGFISHEAHFIPGSDQLLAPALFNQQIVTQLATFPIGSPSGGFSFVFDPTLGTFERTTQSFGPAFAERALTNGEGRLTFGVNTQYSRYTSFEGQDLRNGDVTFYLRHEDSGGLFFEGDIVEAALNLDLSSSTTTIFANYGVSERFDVALAVPIVRVNMTARVDAEVLPFATPNIPGIHVFPNGTKNAAFSSAGSAAGIGDLLVRSKYRFFDAAGGGLAAGVDVRLPTGNDEDLLGTGAAAVAGTLIGSTTVGRWAPHFNVGFTKSGSGNIVNAPDEFGYRLGTEFIATPTVTLNTTLIGRTLIDAGRLQLTDTTWNFVNNLGVPGSTSFQEYTVRGDSLNLVSLAMGGKFNVAGNVLVSANVLVALSSAGVTARVTPVVGIDYSF